MAQSASSNPLRNQRVQTALYYARKKNRERRVKAQQDKPPPEEGE